MYKGEIGKLIGWAILIMIVHQIASVYDDMSGITNIFSSIPRWKYGIHIILVSLCGTTIGLAFGSVWKMARPLWLEWRMNRRVKKLKNRM